MSLHAEVEKEIAIFEEIRRDLTEKGYDTKDINNIINYINDVITNISLKLGQKSEITEKPTNQNLKRIRNELNSTLELSFKELNKKLDRKFPPNFYFNLSDDFISETIREISISKMAREEGDKFEEILNLLSSQTLKTSDEKQLSSQIIRRRLSKVFESNIEPLYLLLLANKSLNILQKKRIPNEVPLIEINRQLSNILNKQLSGRHLELIDENRPFLEILEEPNYQQPFVLLLLARESLDVLEKQSSFLTSKVKSDIRNMENEIDDLMFKLDYEER